MSPCYGAIAAAIFLLAVHPMRAQQASAFRIEETSIALIHQAMLGHRVTAREVVQRYLDRIEAYDKRGPRINSLIIVNPEALRAADAADAALVRSGKLSGPLHGIPIIVKDNIDTDDLPTTAGVLALAGSRPPTDAFVVRRLRAAGAIILAKANLPDFAAATFDTVSSVLPGYTRNPYDLYVSTAGSSGGTAAAVAANLGAVGLGTDTGNSIRGPASHTSLVGIRPTLGLVSRDGIVPLDPERDVTGPMTRTVADAALVLSVIAGDDPSDVMSARGRGHMPANGYTAHLKVDALRAARIGVLRQLSNTPTTDREVLQRFEEALQEMRRRGAVLVDPAMIPGAERLAQRTPRECRAFREALGAYLATLGANAPVRSLGEILASGKYHPSLEARFRLYQEAKRPEDNPECRTAEHQVDQLRSEVETLLDDQRLDALVYPSWNNPPRLLGDLNTPDGSNGPRIASVVGFPAITVPMGYVQNAALPVGIEILGNAWSEPRLIEIAYAYEQATRHRKPPANAPPLSRDLRRRR